VLSDTDPTSFTFTREHLRAPLTLFLLVLIPVFFVVIFASVLGDFAKALGGTLVRQSAAAISAGWAAAFLSGTLAFFQVNSSRGADRRLAAAGLGAGRVAIARITAALTIGLAVSAVAFVTLWVNSGIGHPLHAAIAITSFAVIYIGLGAVIGAFVRGTLEGALLILLVFSLDAFSSPQMTSNGTLAFTPTRSAADLLIAAGGAHNSPGADWLSTVAIALGALAVAFIAFWLAARTRST
jgi:hypothetical protein